MYRCNGYVRQGIRKVPCGHTFSEPDMKERSVLSILSLTIRAMKDPSISREDCFMPVCPFCGSRDIERISGSGRNGCGE